MESETMEQYYTRIFSRPVIDKYIQKIDISKYQSEDYELGVDDPDDSDLDESNEDSESDITDFEDPGDESEIEDLWGSDNENEFLSVTNNNIKCQKYLDKNAIIEKSNKIISEVKKNHKNAFEIESFSDISRINMLMMVRGLFLRHTEKKLTIFFWSRFQIFFGKLYRWLYLQISFEYFYYRHNFYWRLLLFSYQKLLYRLYFS